MSDYTVRAVGTSGSLAPHLTPQGHVCVAAGLSVLAMPPGPVVVETKDVPLIVSVVPNHAGCTVDHFRINGSRFRDPTRIGRTGHIDVFAEGGEQELRAENYGWELLVELDESRVGAMAAEVWDGEARPTADFASRADPAAVQLARLAIEHLRFGPLDRLYVEGLAVALTARAIGFAIGRETTVSTAGTDARIARAVDFIEAHLADDLSLAAIASAACMSLSWLKTSFRAATGKPVWTYVQERRLERARLLLADRDLSLAQIAYESGFSSHSHMTRAFRQRFGLAPKDMR